MIPSDERFPLGRFPSMSRNVQFPTYMQQTPPLHESYTFNSTVPMQGTPILHRSEFEAFKSYFDNLLVRHQHRIEACEQRIMNLEHENYQLRFHQERSSIDATDANTPPLPITSLPMTSMDRTFDPLNQDSPAQMSSPADSNDDAGSGSIQTISQIHGEVPIVPLPMDVIKFPRGQLYIMGGLDNAGKMNRTVEKFDVPSEFWSQISAIPEDLHCVHSSAVVFEREQAFILSAFPTVHQNFKLSFTSEGELDRWCVVSNQQSELSCLRSFAPLSNKICSVGGYYCYTPVLWSSSPVPFPPDLSVLSVSSTVQIYDPQRDIWDRLQSLPTGKIRPALVSSELYTLYSLGGLVLGNQCLQPTNEMSRFDIREGTWETLAPMSKPRAFFNAVGTGSYNLIAMGGISASFYGDSSTPTLASQTVEQYDLRMNRWVELRPLVEQRCVFTCHLLNDDEIYVLGGQHTLNLSQDHSGNILDTEKYSLSGKAAKSGLGTGAQGERSAHVSFLLE